MVIAPKAALIGRTNVGKSSLFNKMVEELKSLVSEIPGTTRDRFEADCLWRAKVIRIVDTGGLDVNKADEIEKNVIMQTEKAMKAAQVILFVVDLTVGPTVDDYRIAKELLHQKTPVIVVGNKADSAQVRAKADSAEWANWPLMKPLPISAKQGVGVGDLLDMMTEILEKAGTPPVDITEIMPMRVAVLGEPNVGKSTLLNSILGEERFITANVPHTTREPNDAMIEHEGKTYIFVDTAGIRKHAAMMRTGNKLEEAGVERTLEFLKRAQVALFVMDVTRGITAQDRHLAGVLAESGVSTVIVVNKWDLVENKTPTSVNKMEAEVRGWLPQLKYAPVIFTSALTGQRAKKLFPLIDLVFSHRFTRLSDDEAHQFMSQAIVRHKPVKGKGVKSPKVESFTQRGVNPPRFVLEVDLPRKDSLDVSYVRFLENLLREHYEFGGTPIRIRIQAGKKSHTTY
ncbi:MAG: ribosome biogenesis GTPase Der [Patescibacteria group bacterium]|jgi:GTP-binding protein